MCNFILYLGDKIAAAKCQNLIDSEYYVSDSLVEDGQGGEMLKSETIKCFFKMCCTRKCHRCQKKWKESVSWKWCAGMFSTGSCRRGFSTIPTLFWSPVWPFSCDTLPVASPQQCPPISKTQPDIKEKQDAVCHAIQNAINKLFYSDNVVCNDAMCNVYICKQNNTAVCPYMYPHSSEMYFWQEMITIDVEMFTIKKLHLH